MDQTIIVHFKLLIATVTYKIEIQRPAIKIEIY